MRYPSYIETDIPLPAFVRVVRKPPTDQIRDIATEIRRQTAAMLSDGRIRSGDRVAVAVGSRGIAQLPAMVRSLCRTLRTAGAEPFIAPAMGSHGSATSEGQREVLQRLGITERDCEAPIRASMNTRMLGDVFGEVPLSYGEDFLTAEHAVCINRIKPHTKFKGPIESGLTKMLCVGMGKHEGALSYHRWAMKYGFYPLLEEMGAALARKSNFRFGIAVVENEEDRAIRIQAVAAVDVAAAEPGLLRLAKQRFPRLPFQRLDALIIQQVGKEISGAGMDPNVTGRAYDLKESDFSEMLQATRVAVLNLSPLTGGNAIGVGNADIITEKVLAGMDYEATLMNALTSLSLHKAFIPVRMPDDRKAIQACLTTIGPIEPQAARVVIIQDTAHVAEFWASEALLPEITQQPELIVGEGAPLAFDAAGNLQLIGQGR